VSAAGTGTGAGDPRGPGSGSPSGRPLAPLTRTDPPFLGAYTLLGRLGSGGMGTVYLGRGPGARLVAVKVIRSEYAELPQYRAQFRREAELARRVARFCTAEVIEVVDGDPSYLVTEYVRGPTLSQAVADGGPLRPGDLERVAVSVAAALAAIHRAGLIHRDLKPANVLLSDLGPRVIDFGIARAAESVTTMHPMPRSPGTPAFMAPEQATGEVVTTAADIFAWGGLVAFAGTGRLPFGEGTSPAQLYRVVHTEPTLDGLDEPVLTVVRRAMSKRPADRPTADELLIQMVGLASASDGPPSDGVVAPDPDVTQITQITRLAQPPRPPSPRAAPTPTPTPTPAPAPTPRAAPTVPEPAPTPEPTPGPWPATESDVEPGTVVTQIGAGGSPPPAPRPGRRRWLRRRVAVLAAGLVVLVALAVAVPLLVARGGGAASQADASGAAAAAADRVRATDPALAARLSLAAFRLAPTPAAAGAVISSYAVSASRGAPAAATSVLGAAVSPNGRLAATGGGDALVRLWDISTGTPRPLATLRGHTDWVPGVAFSPDGAVLASGSVDGTIRLWDVRRPSAPTLLAAVPAGNRGVRRMVFSPNGRVLAVAGLDNTTTLWDVARPASPVRVGVLTGHTDAVQDVAYSPDGTLLAAASKDSTVQLWQVSRPAAPALLATIPGRGVFIWSVSFRADGRLLATGDFGGAVHLYDITRPRQPSLVSVITTGHHAVYTVAFTAGGWLLVAGDDTRLDLWDVREPTRPARSATTGVPARMLPAVGHLDWVQDARLFDGGRGLVTVYDDGTVRVWNLNPTDLAALACRAPANRISAAEWSRYIPKLPYRPVC
jgi:serine/threonine protein kinase